MSKDKIAESILINLESVSKLRVAVSESESLSNKVKALKIYQKKRLEKTHVNLFQNQDTRGAAEFFLSEIYSDKDFSKRDKDLNKVVPMMTKIFNQEMLVVLDYAFELDYLTEKMDVIVAKNLSGNFTDDEYEKVYANKTSFEDRSRQIYLTDMLGKKLISITKLPLIGGLLNKMGLPAKLMGMGDIHNLLKNGFNIFKNTPDIDGFLIELIDKEKSILNTIYNK